MHKLRNLLGGGTPPYRNDYVTFWGGGGYPPNVTLNKTRPKRFTVVGGGYFTVVVTVGVYPHRLRSLWTVPKNMNTILLKLISPKRIELILMKLATSVKICF